MIKFVFQEKDSQQMVSKKPVRRLLQWPKESFWLPNLDHHCSYPAKLPKLHSAPNLKHGLGCIWRCAMATHSFKKHLVFISALGHDRHWEHTCWSNRDVVGDTRMSHSVFWMITLPFPLFLRTSAFSSPILFLSSGLASYFTEKIEAIRRTSLSSQCRIHQPVSISAHKLCLLPCAVDKLSSLFQAPYLLINSRMSLW